MTAHGCGKLPPGLTLNMVIEAEESDNGRGFCMKCGAERDGWTEPDVEDYPCDEGCGNFVHGAQEILLMVIE